MTDDFEARLRAAGYSPEHPRWVRAPAGDLSQLPALKRQRELVGRLAEVLRAQLTGDVAQLDETRAALARLRHGGGQ